MRALNPTHRDLWSDNKHRALTSRRFAASLDRHSGKGRLSPYLMLGEAVGGQGLFAC